MTGRVESRFTMAAGLKAAGGSSVGGSFVAGADFERALSGAMASSGDAASLLPGSNSSGNSPIELQLYGLIRSMMDNLLKGADDGQEGAIRPSALPFGGPQTGLTGLTGVSGISALTGLTGDRGTGMFSAAAGSNPGTDDKAFSNDEKYAVDARVEEASAVTQKTASVSNNLHSGRDFEQIIDAASNKYGVDAGLIRAVIRVESGGNPRAVSQAGAEGLMQLMPETAAELGVKNSFDPAQNIMGGTQYLSKLLARYRGDTKMALAAYNWGMGNLERAPHRMPPETRNYVQRVQGEYNSLTG